MRSRKGQAAMEFLMTYGWAILVVLAAIGALAYFGILSPQRFLPSGFTMTGGFSGAEYKVATGGTVQLGVINNIGTGVEVSKVMLNTTSASAVSCGVESTETQAGNVTQANGVKTVYNFVCSGISAADEGKKVKANVAVTYMKDGETLSHTSTGDLTATVEV